ncbi:deoxyribose-phosphate aldolase [Zhouia amylolytica]|uniref:Deoxyribose-phosphate aldolase n=1 Tax=Zhouia amylolytica TaxID=376730 RepID=A0A1I6QXZ5_9FLAO|nr:deoxyribose-phosphate aldolase [Zhouia amylolytica]MCQ0110815.1 deoxyribose-phosphate aldolase [Zhouia amylolytica]SFS57316.1 deoxyribose-phosphate aldolase [Zhouia amylolytica]
MELNKYIDHTLLKPTATFDDIEKLCHEADIYKFFSVCVNGAYIHLAKELLRDSEVAICGVVGFPLGAMSGKSKVYEAEQSIEDGADEIDMVINIGGLKSGKHSEVLQEISFIRNVLKRHTLKVIIETCYLTDLEKTTACKIAVDAGADFIKTSTGFGTGGATYSDIKLMKKAINGKAKLKASGGIKDYNTAKEYIDLGVDRIGTSNGIRIVKKINL